MTLSVDSLHLAHAFDYADSSAQKRVIPNPDAQLLWDLQDERLSFTGYQLSDTIRKAAYEINGAWRALTNTDVKGARICLVMTNSAEYVTTYLAIAGLSAVNALLNPKFKKEEFLYAMKDMQCKLLIVQTAGNAAAEAAAKELKIPIVTMGWNLDVTPPTPKAECRDGKSCAAQTIALAPNGNDLSLLLHTSGTTAAPKTVPITQANQCATLGNIAQTYKWNCASDSTLLIMPLFHVHGLFAGCLSPLSRGVRIVLARDGGFHKTTFWADAAKAKATWVTAVPTMWQILLNTRAETAPSPLPVKFRFIRGCSSALPAPVALELEKFLGCEVLEAYAMSEATHQMCSNPLNKRRKFGSVGLPFGVDVAIIDGESGKVQSRGQPGEICVRGHNVITGYLGLSEEDQKKHFHYQDKLDWTAKDLSFLSSAPDLKSDKGGDYMNIMAAYYDLKTDLVYRNQPSESPIQHKPFLRTGDVGIMDAEGFVSLVGRSKELINRGGEKISPLEIDAEFLKAAEVVEAGSFGAPDDMLGEVVHMAVVLGEGIVADEALFKRLRENAKGALAAFKIPVKIYAAPELPKGNTGKILRRELLNFVKEKQLKAF